MRLYISPIEGYIDEKVYRTIVTSSLLGHDAYLKAMRSIKYGELRASVLYVENSYLQPTLISGSELASILSNYRFKRATDIVRVFAANYTLVNDLVKRGYSEEYVVYGMNLRKRLKELGLISRTITTSFALESDIRIYPVIEVVPPPVEVVPFIPPVLIIYRSQATFTYSKGKKKVELRIWYQSYIKIEEQELIDKWNEANENATSLPDSNLGSLLDSLEPSPGFELNHEIDESEVERNLSTWYGVLIFTDIKTGKRYEYEVL